MENMIITKADLVNPESKLYEVMASVENAISQMESAAKELRKKHQEICEYLAENDATAEELEENFFAPMNDVMDELDDFLRG